MGGRDWADRGAERVEIIRRKQSLNRLETHPSTTITRPGRHPRLWSWPFFYFFVLSHLLAQRLEKWVSGHSFLFINILKTPGQLHNLNPNQTAMNDMSQREGKRCWSAAAAILLGWRKRQSSLNLHLKADRTSVLTADMSPWTLAPCVCVHELLNHVIYCAFPLPGVITPANFVSSLSI